MTTRTADIVRSNLERYIAGRPLTEIAETMLGDREARRRLSLAIERGWPASAEMAEKLAAGFGVAVEDLFRPPPPPGRTERRIRRAIMEVMSGAEGRSVTIKSRQLAELCSRGVDRRITSASVQRIGKQIRWFDGIRVEYERGQFTLTRT